MTIILLLSYGSSYAAVIQIADTTASTFTGGTISDFYIMAEGLKGTGQALDGAMVDVKMANNYEWAVVSYFSNSAYGTNGAGQNKGKQIWDVKWRYSTNENVTGVMDWGVHKTYTAGIIASYASKTLTTDGNLTSNSTRNVILENAGTNRVDKIPKPGTEVLEKMAVRKWYDVYNYVGDNPNYPYSGRQGLFNMGIYSASAVVDSSGKANEDTTFRPVIWN